MHAQCKLSEEKGKFCFLRAFSKNDLKTGFLFRSAEKKLKEKLGKNSRKMKKNSRKIEKTQGKRTIFTFSWVNKEICRKKSRIFEKNLWFLLENSRIFAEKLKNFQKYSISGKFIYTGCLYYSEKGSLAYFAVNSCFLGYSTPPSRKLGKWPKKPGIPGKFPSRES